MRAKAKVSKSKMVEHSCSTAPTFVDVPTFTNVYLCHNVTPLTPILQMYICAQMYPTYPTFTNVYLYHNVPHLPHFCKYILVPQYTPLTQLIQMFICTPIYPTYPNHPILKVVASTKQASFPPLW